MKSFQKINLFSEDVFFKVKKFCVEQSSFFNDKSYSKMFGRYYRLVFFPEDIHNEILKKANECVPDANLKIIYSQIIKYQLKDGNIPTLESHRDNLNCHYIINLVLDTTINWPLVVEKEAFPSIENSAVILKGDEDGHWRDQYPSDSESDYLLLLFVHLSPEDSASWRMAKAIYDLPESARETVARNFLPGVDGDSYGK